MWFSIWTAGCYYSFLVSLLSVTEHIFQVINHISLIVIYGQVEIKKNL